MMNAFSVHNGGHAAVSAVTYRDILLEGVLGQVSHDESYGYKLVDLQVSQGKYSGPDMSRRGSISDVLYDNVTYRSNGIGWVSSRMVGNSSAHAVDGVHINGFTINGTAVTSLAQLGTLQSGLLREVIQRTAPENSFRWDGLGGGLSAVRSRRSGVNATLAARLLLDTIGFANRKNRPKKEEERPLPLQLK